MKVAFNPLVQMSKKSENSKSSDTKSTNFETVMKQNNQKPDNTSTKKISISTKKVDNEKELAISKDDWKEISNDSKKILEQNSKETIAIKNQEITEMAVDGKLVQNIISETMKTEVPEEAKEDVADIEVDEELSVQVIVSTIMDSVSQDDNTENMLLNKDVEHLMQTVEAFLEPLQENIQNIVKEDVKIDDEDIQKILEQLGISMIDLLEASNLQQFVLKNAGEEISALLTNETLAVQFNQLLTDVNTMCQKVETNQGISKQEIKQLSLVKESITIFQNVKQEEDVVSFETQKMLEEVTNIDNKELSKLLEKVATLVKKNVSEDNIQPFVSDIIFDTKQAENVDNVYLETTKTEFSENNFIIVEKDNIQENTEHSSKQQSSGEQAQTKENVIGQFVEELVQAQLGTKEITFERTEQLQQMREIVTQVVEQIKVVVKEDTSAMEIQLNPEKLGKVNLSVVSKNGQMTASFVTESEMAKNALESQMQQLKDTLQNQGLKVDAIEVSVSDFKFEQSSNMNEEQQRQHSANKKKAPRKIDLSMLDDGFDELSEADTLAAQVMIDNGNTVDYTA